MDLSWYPRVEKLKLRFNEVDQLEKNNVRYDDPKKAALESEIAATIEDVFGSGSRENREHSFVRIHIQDPTRMAGFNESRHVIDQRSQDYFLRGIAETREMLATA